MPAAALNGGCVQVTYHHLLQPNAGGTTAGNTHVHPPRRQLGALLGNNRLRPDHRARRHGRVGVAAGWLHTCGVTKLNSTTLCWGYNGEGRTTVPKP